MKPPINPGISIDLLDKLAQTVWARPAKVIGCTRQHILWPDKPWRWLRGNAILSAIGEKVEIEAPFGAFGVFLVVDGEKIWLLQYRGGNWCPWWDEDAALLASLVSSYTQFKVAGTVTIVELDGQIRLHYTELPAEAAALTKEAVDRWTNQARLPKDQPRARTVCRYCPVKNQCELMDLERGETADWQK